MPSVGSNAVIGIGQETLWGSGTVTVTKFIPFVSESITKTKEVQFSNAIRGSTSRSIWRTGKTSVGGDISVEVIPDSAGIFTLFYNALGRVVTAGPSGAGYYTHRIMPSGTLPEGMRVEVERDAAAFTYSGMKVQNMTMECKVGDPLTASFTLIGDDETTSDTPTTSTTISTLNPLTYDEGNLYVDGSATATEISGFSISLANNLAEDKGALGSASRVALPRSGFREVTGTLSAEFDNLLNYNRFINGTETVLKLSFVSDNHCAGTTDYQLDIHLPRVVFTGNTPTVGGPDLIYHDLPFLALYSTNGGYDEKDEIRMILTSNIAAV
jgi:hypothetical protein